MPKKKIVSNDLTLIKPYADYAIEILHTGSRVICDPPVKDTDDDWLFLCESPSAQKLEKQLKEDGFSNGGSQIWRKETIYSEPANPSDIPVPIGWVKQRKTTNAKVPLIKWPTVEDIQNREGLFHSWKKEILNIVITCSPELFENFVKATFLAKDLNLIHKDDRIVLFEAIKYDKWPSYPSLIITRDAEGVMKL